MKAAASNFTLNVCRLRPKLVLQDFLNHLMGIMGRYSEVRQSGNEPMDIARTMDGALTAIGTLEPVVIKKVSLNHCAKQQGHALESLQGRRGRFVAAVCRPMLSEPLWPPTVSSLLGCWSFQFNKVQRRTWIRTYFPISSPICRHGYEGR